MANKFELAELARTDLKAIWVHFAEFNQNSADRFMRNLAKKFQMLADNPKLGRTQDNLLLNLRSFPYKNYTVFYFLSENGVEIFRVLHGARNIEDLFENYFEGLKP